MLADFGLAASAKDCSIIITIGVLDGNGAIAPPRKSGAAESGAILNDGKFAYRVAVTDLGAYSAVPCGTLFPVL